MAQTARRVHLMVRLSDEEQAAYKELARLTARTPSRLAEYLIRRILLEPQTNTEHAARGDVLHGDLQQG